jgi:hypothetical protein
MAEGQPEMRLVTDNGAGFNLKMKWVLVEAAPLTASGLNEIITGAPTKDLVWAMAGTLSIGPKQIRTGRYQIVKLADIYQKEEE